MGDDLPSPSDLYVNQYVIHRVHASDDPLALIEEKAYRFDGRSLVDVRSKPIKGFSPLNVEQRCLFDLLDDDEIPVKIVKGVAGSGKTKGAMQFALSKVLDGKRFDRYLIVRNPVTVGEEVGYLKGSLADKLAPWQSAVIDNLEGGRATFDTLVRNGKLEWDVPAFMQGRDLKRTFVHVTEAQMLTFDQLRMIGSRISQGSVLVIEGDDDQVLNKRYVENNGLRQIVGKLVGSPLVGYVRLTRSVRSPVAEMFAKL